MPSDDKRIAASEAMVRRRFAELDAGNISILDELFAPSYLLYFPGLAKPMSLETTKRFYKLLYAAFPDLRHTIIEQVSAGDQVVTRWKARGTHRGAWMGVEPTRKRVVFGGINIYTIIDGKFIASQVNWDILGILQQVGAVKARIVVPASTKRTEKAR